MKMNIIFEDGFVEEVELDGTNPVPFKHSGIIKSYEFPTENLSTGIITIEE